MMQQNSVQISINEVLILVQIKVNEFRIIGCKQWRHQIHMQNLYKIDEVESWNVFKMCI